MRFPWPALLLLAVALGLSLGIILSFGQQEPEMHQFLGVIPKSFAAEGPEYATMERLCPCGSINVPGTDERTISNAAFYQEATDVVNDPRGLSTWAWVIFQVWDHEVTLTATNTSAPVSTIPFNHEINLRLRPNQFVIDNQGCKLAKTFITAATDGTPIYADSRDPERAHALREGRLGRLKLTDAGFLPRDRLKPNEFFAGDVRATEHAMLATMHTLWAREHNKVASEIHAMVPALTDEQLYWKARQITTAKFQRIIYEEALPALYGEAAFNEFVANSNPPVRGTGMRISSEFSNAAFRFGHSMVANNVGPFKLTELFFNANLLESVGLENMIQAAQNTSAQAVDLKVVDGLRNILFGRLGEDLVARNLFTARATDVPTYQALAACYGFTAVQGVVNADPLRGLLSEPIMPGSSLPRGIAIIVGEQFNRTFQNDPNFYQRSEEAIGAHFWPQVKSVTLKDIIVRNTKLEAAQVPDNVFFVTRH